MIRTGDPCQCGGTYRVSSTRKNAVARIRYLQGTTCGDHKKEVITYANNSTASTNGSQRSNGRSNNIIASLSSQATIEKASEREMIPVQNNPRELVTVDQVLAEFGLCDVTLRKLISEGRFPRPLNVGGRGRKWLRRQLDEHFDDLAEAASQQTGLGDRRSIH